MGGKGHGPDQQLQHTSLVGFVKLARELILSPNLAPVAVMLF